APSPQAVEAVAPAPSAGALPGMPGAPAAAIPSAAPAGGADRGPPARPAAAAAAATAPGPAAHPPAAATPHPRPPRAGAAAADHRVTVTTDVLRLSLDGGNVFDAQLLQYPQDREQDSPPVKLLDDDPASYYIARSGWVGQGGSTVPGLVPEAPARRQVALADGQQAVQVSFVSPADAPVRIRRTYTLSRGSYAIAVHDEVLNASGQPWQGYVYRQLARIPPDTRRGVGSMTNPESYS